MYTKVLGLDAPKKGTRSLHSTLKGISHFVQWRRPGDDGAGSTRGKNTGCGPTTKSNP